LTGHDPTERGAEYRPQRRDSVEVKKRDAA